MTARFTKIGKLSAAAIAALSFWACGEDKPTPPPTQPVAQLPQPAARSPEPVKMSTNATAETEAQSETSDEIVVKRFRPERDPFQSVFATKKVRVSPGGITHPLQQFSIGQLKLLGIIWGIASPVALVATPGGDEYIVKTGTPVGTGDGKVVAILPDKVVILERYYDYRGQLQTEKYELVLANEGK